MNFGRSNIEYNDRTIPIVRFNNCNDLKLLIGDWLGTEKSVSGNIGLLMLKLDILSDSDDTVEIYNFNSSDCSFLCIINNKDIYNIRFKNLNLVGFNPEIEVSCFNIKRTYECIPMDRVELGMRVIQKEQSIYENGVCFTRSLSMENVVFTIRNKNYVLELGVAKPRDLVLPLFNEDGKYSKYELDNELELVKYLTGLEFPLSIVDVYRDICRISLGDVGQYPRMFLKVFVDNFKSQKVTDLIHLENGQLERFGMTVNGTNKIVFLDKYGNWSYEVYGDGSYVKIDSLVDENRTNYNVCVDNSSNCSIQELVSGNMEYAREDIEDVKVRVRNLFDEKKLIYWESEGSN